MFTRELLATLQASPKSILLLGPRQVGKSTLMRQLNPEIEINLAHEPTYLEFARNPGELESRLDALPSGKSRRVFLTIISQWTGQHLDLAKIAQAAQVPRQSAGRWFEVLEDTLLVIRAESFAKSLTRRLVQHPKFYFFDVGVLNGLLGSFEVSADRVGALFEHFIFDQIVHTASALEQTIRVSTFRTEHGAEVDFIVERGRELFAIELKASRTISAGDTRGLQRFAEYLGRAHRSVLLYLGPERKYSKGRSCHPPRTGGHVAPSPGQWRCRK